MNPVEIVAPVEAHPRMRKAFGRSRVVRFVSELPPVSRGQLFVCGVGHLPDRKTIQRVARSKLPIVLLPAEHQLSTEALQRLLALRCAGSQALEPLVIPNHEALRRIVFAKSRDADAKLIATASVEGSELVVWSCEPKQFRCPVSELPPLAKLRPKELLAFQISSTGTRLRWPKHDIDLGLDTFREYCDPSFREEHRAHFEHDAEKLGRAIKILRSKHQLLQSSFDGLSARQVRRLERGETLPQLATLKTLAKAHGLTPKAYVDALLALG